MGSLNATEAILPLLQCKRLPLSQVYMYAILALGSLGSAITVPLTDVCRNHICRIFARLLEVPLSDHIRLGCLVKSQVGARGPYE